MKTRIKVCCIASIAEAKLAIVEGADALGLVARMPSGPGPISDDKILNITQQVPPQIATFMLTSETKARDITAHIKRTAPSTVQIVSHIDPSESEKLASMTGHVKRVQVIHVEDETALELIPQYAPFVHAFLLDSGKPNAKIAEFGGTGRTHDWEISHAFVKTSPLPVFLAGGLNPSNVVEAIKMVKPYGVDLCSGVRTKGKLDREKLRRFISAVKSAP